MLLQCTTGKRDNKNNPGHFLFHRFQPGKDYRILHISSEKKFQKNKLCNEE